MSDLCSCCPASLGTQLEQSLDSAGVYAELVFPIVSGLVGSNFEANQLKRDNRKPGNLLLVERVANLHETACSNLLARGVKVMR